jgi:hypothetical protein
VLAEQDNQVDLAVVARVEQLDRHLVKGLQLEVREVLLPQDKETAVAVAETHRCHY